MAPELAVNSLPDEPIVQIVKVRGEDEILLVVSDRGRLPSCVADTLAAYLRFAERTGLKESISPVFSNTAWTPADADAVYDLASALIRLDRRRDEQEPGRQ